MRAVLGFVALLMFSLSLPAAAQSSDLRDARLVGTWVNEDNYNSEGGAGFAFQSTVMVMQLGADGSVVQTTRTVSGGMMSTDSGEQVDFTGEWRADGQTMSVMGMGLTDFVPAATYRFVDTYLVTQNDMGELIWQRR